MVEIRLKAIADRLGKSITDIARETGLNRNTVTGLYHSKVDGIKFATIDSLCDTYGIRLSDLIARKETRLGGAPASRIVRELRAEPPFFSWHWLNALHQPSAQYFSEGAGRIYAYFARDMAEFYFDGNEASRSARAILERYGRGGVEEVHGAFIQARDQLNAYLVGLNVQPIKQFMGADLAKTAQRLSDLYADALALSAWTDLFDFGARDEAVSQAQKAHNLTAQESSALIASGEMTAAVVRRVAAMKLVQERVGIEHKNAKKFLQAYPYISVDELAREIEGRATDLASVSGELDELTNLPRRHADVVRKILRAHGMRTNPLAFFAVLSAWSEERDEMDRSARFQLARLLDAAAGRARINPGLARYLLPQEIPNAMNGLVSEATLRQRHDRSMLIALEHGEFKVHEGERAVSVQDDLVSRYMSQLAYGNV